MYVEGVGVGGKGRLLFEDKGGMRGSQGYLLPANTLAGTLCRDAWLSPLATGSSGITAVPYLFSDGDCRVHRPSTEPFPSQADHTPPAGEGPWQQS